jgi:diguanylate cyclase (GGDEF)-like protein
VNRLLSRQIARATKRTGTLDIELLLELVDAAYCEADRERDRNNRATLLTCEEMDKLNEELRELAHHDSLTGLPNRLSFAQFAKRAVARARLGESLAVLLVDLDRFKLINDTLGHATGDALLCQVAERLRGATRETDMIARIGGDEFAVVQVGLSAQPADAESLAERLVNRLSAPYEVRRQEMNVGASIGIAVAGTGMHDVDLLLRNADVALYHAKNAGRNTWRVFEARWESAKNDAPVPAVGTNERTHATQIRP